MLIYVIQIVFIILFGILTNNSKRLKKIYHFSVFLLLVMIAGLRNPYMGLGDFTSGYLIGWRFAKDARLTDVLFHSREIYDSLKDPGYALLLKTLSYINTNEFFFQFVISIPYYATMCWFIYKYSSKGWLSYIVAMTLQYFTLTFYLIRPMCAITFILLAFDALVKEKKKQGILYIIIATLMHSSAIVFLLFFVIKRIKNTNYYLAIIGTAFMLGQIGKPIFGFIVSHFLSNTRYIYYLTADFTEGLNRFFVAMFFLIIEVYCFHRIKDTKNDKHILLNMSMVNTALFAMTPLMADFWRMALYFNFANWILFPEALMSMKQINKWVITIISCLLFFVYLFLFLLPGTNAMPYYTYF